MRRFNAASGRERPVSMRETSISFVPIFSASCNWVIPFSARAARNLLFVAITGFCFVTVANHSPYGSLGNCG